MDTHCEANGHSPRAVAGSIPAFSTMNAPKSASTCNPARQSWELIAEVVESSDPKLLDLLTYKDALRYYALCFPKDLIQAFSASPLDMRERVLIVLSSYARKQFVEIFPQWVEDLYGLSHFLNEIERFRGKGRTIVRAVRTWFQAQNITKLENNFIVQRRGVLHWPLARILHNFRPDPGFERARRVLYRWGMGYKELTFPPNSLKQLQDFLRLQDADETTACGIIARWELPKEIIPSRLYAYTGVRRIYSGE